MKRKTIFNNLKRFIVDHQLIETLLLKSNLNPMIRPDQISVKQYQDFFNCYQFLLNK